MRVRILAVFSAILPLVLTCVVTLAAPARAAGTTSRPVLTGLTTASALAVAPNNRIFVGEQTTGTIYVVNPATNQSSIFYRVPRNQQLIGLVAHYAFPSTPYLYGYGLRHDTTGTVRMQLFRITASGNIGTGLTVLRDFGGLPADHYGGRMVFGPDHLLYVSVGDGGVPADSQKRALDRGKILRMTDTGAVAPGNPFNTRVFAYGTRNVFGSAFDPASGRLWATDNGPECNDELNLIARGANYGWGPTATCTTPPTPASTNRDGPAPVLPKGGYGAPVAPTGLAFCRACGLGAAVEGNLVYGTYVTGELRRVTLNSARTGVVGEAVLLQHTAGIVGLERAPNGALWFLDRTSLNRVVQQ